MNPSREHSPFLHAAYRHGISVASILSHSTSHKVQDAQAEIIAHLRDCDLKISDIGLLWGRSNEWVQNRIQRGQALRSKKRVILPSINEVSLSRAKAKA